MKSGDFNQKLSQGLCDKLIAQGVSEKQATLCVENALLKLVREFKGRHFYLSKFTLSEQRNKAPSQAKEKTPITIDYLVFDSSTGSENSEAIYDCLYDVLTQAGIDDDSADKCAHQVLFRLISEFKGWYISFPSDDIINHHIAMLNGLRHATADKVNIKYDKPKGYIERIASIMQEKHAYRLSFNNI